MLKNDVIILTETAINHVIIDDYIFTPHHFSLSLEELVKS